MVSSFQNTDPNVGFGIGYGPSAHKGDLQGVIDSLDYIKDLGCNAIWMTPIFESNLNDHRLASTGYSPTNYFKVDDRFGGNQKLKELVAAAHNKGIYVILDGVFGHHGINRDGSQIRSLNGKTITDRSTDPNPSDETKYVKYPESKAFFEEVARYWINEYEIDGWRLDVAKELTGVDQDGNYLYNIRKAVEDACDARRAQAKQWGILGYIVAEFWDSIDPLNNHVYTAGEEPALYSAFDFPFRSSLVQILAQDEHNQDKRDKNMMNELKDIHRTPYDKSYRRDDIYPNLFITNHDLYRFGNLIRMRHKFGPENEYYWKYHKLAIGVLAVYTGPITLYYGDEFGDITDCWTGVDGSCPDSTEMYNQWEKVYKITDSSVARTDGHLTANSDKQKDLHDFTKAVISARRDHPSMWRGTYGKTTNGEVYFNCKYDPVTGDKVVFVANFGPETTVTYQVGGVKLYDFASRQVIYAFEDGKYKIPIGNLETRIFQVYDKDEVIPEPVPDCAAAQEAVLQSEKKSNDKKLIMVMVLAGIVVVVVIVIAIAVIVHMKKKYMREAEEAASKSNPLVDMSLE